MVRRGNPWRYISGWDTTSWVWEIQKYLVYTVPSSWRVISFWLFAQHCKPAQMFCNSNAQWTRTVSHPVTFLFRGWVFVFLSSALPGQQINPGHTKWCLIEQYKINSLQAILNCVPATIEAQGIWRQRRWRRRLICHQVTARQPAGTPELKKLEDPKKWKG